MVGISLLTLVPGVFGGSATYARELLRALGRVGELDYVVFVPTAAPAASEGRASRIVTAYRASSSTGGRLLAMSLATLRPAPIRAQLEPASLDAVHFPLTVPLPAIGSPPSATTVHDVLHLAYPRALSRAARVYRRVLFRRIAGSSRLVIVPSAYGRDVLGSRLGLPRERVRVIHHGVDHETFTPGAAASREPVLVYPADGYAHKNHRRLLAAFARVRRTRPELRLVLAGHSLDQRWAGDGVELRPRLSAGELALLYRSASALVFPSLHEIFGLPPLEAMACGCPVAVADAGALTEVCGGAAVYFDPESVDGIVDAVVTVLERGSELAERGLRHASGFSWDACARSHDAVYRELATVPP